MTYPQQIWYKRRKRSVSAKSAKIWEIIFADLWSLSAWTVTFIVEVGIMVYMVYCGMEFLTESCLKFAFVGVSEVDVRPRIIISKG